MNKSLSKRVTVSRQETSNSVARESDIQLFILISSEPYISLEMKLLRFILSVCLHLLIISAICYHAAACKEGEIFQCDCIILLSTYNINTMYICCARDEAQTSL